MKKIKKGLYYFLVGVSLALILISGLSLINDLSLWYAKILDFPRLQYLLLGLICLLLVFITTKDSWNVFSVFLVVGLLGVVIIQSTRILPYYLGDKKVPTVIRKNVEEENSVGIMVSNVLMKNRREEDLLEIVERKDPDMLLVMEVNQWWINQLQVLKEEYQHFVEYPLENTYGIALYSRLPLEGAEVHFLTERPVPSIHTKVNLASGRQFMFYGVHPVPPLPRGKMPDSRNKEEVALLKVGELVAENSLPSIVAGDYNDVSWSHTARLFGKSGNLNNVRLGRGLYNSYSAKSLLQRWPLDHYFVTGEFALGELERLSSFGSDHFPMFAELLLVPQT